MMMNKDLVPKLYNSLAVSSDDKTILRLAGTSLILILRPKLIVQHLIYINACSLMLWFTKYDKRQEFMLLKCLERTGFHFLNNFQNHATKFFVLLKIVLTLQAYRDVLKCRIFLIRKIRNILHVCGLQI